MVTYKWAIPKNDKVAIEYYFSKILGELNTIKWAIEDVRNENADKAVEEIKDVVRELKKTVLINLKTMYAILDSVGEDDSTSLGVAENDLMYIVQLKKKDKKVKQNGK